MIVPMKKVSLVLMDKYREDSLKKLREAGVFHLEQKKVSSDTLSKLLDRKTKTETALTLLKSYKARANAQKLVIPQSTAVRHRSTDFVNPEGVPFSVEALNAPDGKRKDLYLHVLQLGDEQKSLQERTNVLLREQSRLKCWGEFDPRGLQFLKENGVFFHLYEFSSKVFKSLPADVPYFVITQTKAIVYAVVLGIEVPGETAVEPGKYSLTDIGVFLSDIRDQLADIDKQLVSLFFRKHILEAEMKTLTEQIEFEIANVGMEILEDVSDQSAVSWISGFAPYDTLDTLKRAAAENGWALAFDDPAPEDEPPTLLKNNPFARLVKPVFSMLGTIPGYREYDISLSYMIFLAIFFAMIIGDAVYGLVILTAAFVIGMVFKKKSKANGVGKFPDAVKLLVFFSLTTVAWGSVTGSWFGTPHSNLPLALRLLILPPFYEIGPLMEFPVFLQKFFNMPAIIPVDKMKAQWNIQFFCFALGTIQLLFARGKNVKKLLPSLSALGEAGWFVVMLGVYFVVLFLLLRMPVPSFVPYLIGSGIGLVIIFGEQKGTFRGAGHFFANIGKGLKGSFNTVLKIISCFGDIISYIRLFAVGLAGAMVVQTINSMAIPAEGLGNFGLDFFVKLIAALLILAIGHSLQLAMGMLSVVVHGLRLNLLEYAANHLEMMWSGYEYQPFALGKKNNNG